MSLLGEIFTLEKENVPHLVNYQQNNKALIQIAKSNKEYPKTTCDRREIFSYL